MISYDSNLRLNVERDLAQWADTVDWTARRAHLIKMSSEDLELLRPGEHVRKVADEWLDSGALVVVLTDGGKVALRFTERFAEGVDVQPVQVVDTVGAGDTFQVAMLTRLSKKGPLSIAAPATKSAPQLKGALDFSTAAAAVTCTRRGTDMQRRAGLP